MKKYSHKPVEVQAVQVVAPYRGFASAFPRHHAVKSPSTSRLSHYHVVDAVGNCKARPGDYVVKHGDGTVEILSEEKFNRNYEERVELSPDELRWIAAELLHKADQ